MINELIYFLTNRGQGFYSPYVIDASYQPSNSDHYVFKAADHLRKLLKLDVPDTDWYWRPLHAAILADRQCSSHFDITTTVSPANEKPVSPRFYNSRVSGTGNRPKLTWKPSELPDSFEFQFTYTQGKVRYVHGRETGELRCDVAFDVQLNPDLSRILPGTDFGFITNSPPVDPTTFGLYIEPSSYPLPGVLDMCQGYTGTGILLAHYGVQDLYHAIPDDIFKLGLLASCVARATKDHGK